MHDVALRRREIPCLSVSTHVENTELALSPGPMLRDLHHPINTIGVGHGQALALSMASADH
jgi:hypothetical protein